jgi:hypothetical protein
MTELRLTAREPLCDLQMVKADYGSFGGNDGKSKYCFRITLVSSKQTLHFDVREEEGELFAAGFR